MKHGPARTGGPLPADGPLPAIVRRAAAAFCVVAAALCVWGALRLEPKMADVFQWVPDRSPERSAYERFRRDFGADDFLIAWWPGCDVTDPRCDRFGALLVAPGAPAADLYREATSGRDVLRRLGVPVDGASAETLRRAIPEGLRGIYFAESGDETCVVLTQTAKGMDRRREACAAAVDAARRVGVPPGDLRLAGYPVFGAFGDRLIVQTLVNSFLPCCAVTATAAWLFLGSVRAAAAALVVSALAAGLSVAAVTLSGADWGGLSTIIPTLTYILTTSGSIHLLHYARADGGESEADKGEEGNGAPGSGRRALRVGWRPCALSAATTAAGMLPLCRSEFPAVREFGLYCATGIAGSLVCQLLLIPAAVDRFRLAPPHRGGRWLPSGLLPGTVLRRPAAALAVAAAVVGLAAAGLLRLKSDFGVERLFSPETVVRRDAALLKRILGPLQQTEVVVRFSGVTEEGFPERLAAVRALEARLAALPETHATFSVAAWLPEPPDAAGLRGVVARRVYRARLIEARPDLAGTAQLAIGPDRDGHGASHGASDGASDGGREAWRIAVRFAVEDPADFERVRIAVDEAVRRAVAGSDRTPAGTPGEPAGPLRDVRAEGVEVEQTGIITLYHVTQERMLADLRASLLGAFLLICPAMAFTLRSVRLGALVMLPNALPVLTLFGGLGWGGWPVDLTIAVTACVALGIAVDDTTHFAVRFRAFRKTEREPDGGDGVEGEDGDGDGGDGTHRAIRAAYAECAPAMVATTVTVTAGLATFLPTPLLAMGRFAMVLMTTLWLALLCDLFLLPALLTLSGRGSAVSEPDRR